MRLGAEYLQYISLWISNETLKTDVRFLGEAFFVVRVSGSSSSQECFKNIIFILYLFVYIEVVAGDSL
jgi:hypothetical protein